MKTAIAGEVIYHRELISPQLKQPRDVIVWLPPSYRSRPEKRYPVLYVQDGQNLFDPTTAFAGHDWGLDQTTLELIARKKIEEILIVGIYNTPDRVSEYSGSRTGKKYATFLANELKPFIDSAYRTKPDRENSAVMGSSLGGLISFLIAWWYPEIFGQAACMSGSFFWNQYRVVQMVRDYKAPKKKIRLYLDVGSKETLLREGYLRMVELLKQKGYRKGADLEYFLARGDDHNEYDWGNRAWRPLTFLFPRKSKRFL